MSSITILNLYFFISEGNSGFKIKEGKMHV